MSAALRGVALFESRHKALTIARAAAEKQAEEVIIIDVRALCNVTDYFVIGTAGSVRQLTALKEHIETTLAHHGAAVWHSEGSPTPPYGSRLAAPRRATRTGGPPPAAEPAPQWLLMDCGDVVVHLLDEVARDFYRLEDLWADAPRVPVDSLSASTSAQQTSSRSYPTTR